MTFHLTEKAAQLATTCTKPLFLLQQRFVVMQQEIETWFQQEWRETKPPIYGSVDLRNAGFKLAPIDMNLFPAGFNNLNTAYLSCSIDAAKKAISDWMPNAKNILLLPELHTRNLMYWDSIETIQTILTEAGFTIRLGSLHSDEKEVIPITLENGKVLFLDPLIRANNVITLKDFQPDLLLLNNDLSAGIPDILIDIAQPILPPAKLGWSERLKSNHFYYYNEVANAFAKVVDIDPWFISPLFRQADSINFLQKAGVDQLIHETKNLFAAVQKKYDEYQINHQPFIIIKADAGTYGMAVMTIRDIKELENLNRKQRTKMSVSKGGQDVNRVIIQEGVYTFETIGNQPPEEQNAVAEPVVYLWGEKVVGGFYRAHKNRGVDENLNAPGMEFQPLAFSERCEASLDANNETLCCNRFFTYGVIARLSMLAAAREIKDTV